MKTKNVQIYVLFKQFKAFGAEFCALRDALQLFSSGGRVWGDDHSPNHRSTASKQNSNYTVISKTDNYSRFTLNLKFVFMGNVFEGSEGNKTLIDCALIWAAVEKHDLYFPISRMISFHCRFLKIISMDFLLRCLHMS